MKLQRKTRETGRHVPDGIPTDANENKVCHSAVIPMLEAEVALALNLLKNVCQEARYQFEHWFNVLLQSEFADDNDEGYMLSDQSDLSLHGPYLNFAVKF